MPLSIYVHVPFCATRCRYCAFYSGEPLPLLEGYPEQLRLEMQRRAPHGPSGPVETVYFGGGTPSLLAPRSVAAVLEAIDGTWGLAAGAEVSLEANPSGPLDLAGYRLAGVTRLSLGVQCLDDRLLARLGRAHSAAQALSVLARAASAGFSAASADLLLGLPGLGPEDVARGAERLCDAGARHVSIYSLEVHDGTPLGRDVASGAFSPPPPEAEELQWAAADAALLGRGLACYEVSNYASRGHECRHNLVYWGRGAYVGLGPGAHSFDPAAGPWGVRSWNAPDLAAYAESLLRGDPPPGASETLSAEESLLEALFLALRTPGSADLPDIAHRHGLCSAGFDARVREAERQGLLVARGSRWAPSREGLRRADGLALWLFEGASSGTLPP